MERARGVVVSLAARRHVEARCVAAAQAAGAGVPVWWLEPRRSVRVRLVGVVCSGVALVLMVLLAHAREPANGSRVRSRRSSARTRSSRCRSCRSQATIRISSPSMVRVLLIAACERERECADVVVLGACSLSCVQWSNVCIPMALGDRGPCACATGRPRRSNVRPGCYATHAGARYEPMIEYASVGVGVRVGVADAMRSRS